MTMYGNSKSDSRGYRKKPKFPTVGLAGGVMVLWVLFFIAVMVLG